MGEPAAEKYQLQKPSWYDQKKIGLHIRGTLLPEDEQQIR